jgi:hypothetical protein
LHALLLAALEMLLETLVKLLPAHGRALVEFGVAPVKGGRTLQEPRRGAAVMMHERVLAGRQADFAFGIADERHAVVDFVVRAGLVIQFLAGRRRRVIGGFVVGVRRAGMQQP